mgnify:CR=1 FL=1
MQIEWRRIWKVLLGCVCTAAGIALLTCGQLGWGLTALEAAVLLLALQYAPRGTRLWKTWWFAELVLALAVTAGCAGVATVRALAGAGRRHHDRAQRAARDCSAGANRRTKAAADDRRSGCRLHRQPQLHEISPR